MGTRAPGRRATRRWAALTLCLLALVLCVACGPAPCPPGTTRQECGFFSGGLMGCVKPPTVTLCARTMGDAFDQAQAALGPTPAGSSLLCGTPPLRMPPPLHPEGAGGSDVCAGFGGAVGFAVGGAGGTFGGGGSPFGGGFAASSVGAGASPGAGPSSSDVGAGPSGAGGFGELRGRGGAGGAW